jgi:hypothetical protein
MTARTNIHFQEKFFNNPFLSVMNGQKNRWGPAIECFFIGPPAESNLSCRWPRPVKKSLSEVHA